MILTKPINQEELKKRSGGTANLIKSPEILQNKFFAAYSEAKRELKTVLNGVDFNSNHDQIYLSRIQPVGDAPIEMDQKYTPPQHCFRFGISMKGLQNVIKNQRQYYYAYHCIYNKPNQIEILKNIIQHGFQIHPKSPNGQAHGKGIYITPSFSTITNYYSNHSILQLGNKNYQLILQVRVKKGSFSMHKNTANYNDDWPEDITEWLVKQPSPSNLIVFGILLRNVKIFD